MSTENHAGSNGKPFEYGIILPSGETIGGSMEDFPKVLTARLRAAPTDAEREPLAAELLAFYWKSAPERMAEGDWPELLGCVTNLAKRVGILMGIGGRLEEIHAYAAAASVYRAVISLKPDDHAASYFAHNNLGYCLNQLRDFAGGEACCRAALRIDASLPNAHKNLGLALHGQGRLAEAAQAFIVGTLAYPRDGRSLKCLQVLIDAHPGIRAEMPALDKDIARCVAAVANASR